MDAAIESLRTALDLEADNESALSSLVRLLEKKGDLEGSAAYANEMKRRRERNPYFHFALAQAEHAVMLVQRHLYRQGSKRGLTEAGERAKVAVRLRPDLATAHAALGYTFGAFERWREAKASFAKERSHPLQSICFGA